MGLKWWDNACWEAEEDVCVCVVGVDLGVKVILLESVFKAWVDTH